MFKDVHYGSKNVKIMWYVTNTYSHLHFMREHILIEFDLEFFEKKKTKG